MKLTGLHHLTAMASDPARNAAFYMQVLGLRMIKKTINFDDPGAYHLYYGDYPGSPGTALTFFLWPGARRGTPGVGQVTSYAFQIPVGSSDYWEKRLTAKNVESVQTGERFNEALVSLRDPDGFAIDLIETADPLPVVHWAGSDVPAEHCIHGFHGVTMTHRKLDRSASLLTSLMGARHEQSDGNRHRYVLGSGPERARIDIVEDPHGAPGTSGTGIVHHVAWRTPTDETEAEALAEIHHAGIQSSGVIDRSYFHSIYYREPGGVLYEIATDGPGFEIDEPVESLGDQLMLPPWMEARRVMIEGSLPPI